MTKISQFLGLLRSDDSRVWHLPVTPEICGGRDSIYGGCALAAGIEAAEHVTERAAAWATCQFLRPAHAGEIVELHIDISAAGRAVSHVRIIGIVRGEEVFIVLASVGARSTMPGGIPGSAAGLALVGDEVSTGTSAVMEPDMQAPSIDNTLRVVNPKPCQWILADIELRAAAHGFAHGIVNLWSPEGDLLGIASQTGALRIRGT